MAVSMNDNIAIEHSGSISENLDQTLVWVMVWDSDRIFLKMMSHIKYNIAIEHISSISENLDQTLAWIMVWVIILDFHNNVF